jgi:hypothetical protein
MPATPTKPTTAANLEAKFDAGEDVLDFFDVEAASVVYPERNVLSKTRRRTVDELKRAIKLTKQIEKLERELSSILGQM